MKSPDGSLEPLISFYDNLRPICWEALFGRKAPVHVEIGFGMGEVLLKAAREYPQCDFVGIEQNWERIYKTLKKLGHAQPREKLANVKILKLDAHIAFERLFKAKSIEHVLCLFPCPWPKKGHVKHRLFSKDFLKLLNSRLKAQAHVKIVTDHEPFFQWIIHESKLTGFHTEFKTIKPQFNTKFEHKWREQGQEDFFEISMEKVKHLRVPVKKDIALKAYKLKRFNPEHFQPENEIGEITVVFKEFLFDAQKAAGLVYVVVSEQKLIQHFRVAVTKMGDHWLICTADGQRFFPTPGIAKALEWAYKHAKSTC